MILDEPWKRLVDDGSVIAPKDTLIAGHRTLIKNRSDAPHVAIVMPIGNKREDIIEVQDDGTKRIARSYRQPGLVPIELMLNQMQVAQPLNVTLTWFMKKNNISSILREEMTHKAIEMGVNFVFYWDDDVLIPTNTLYRMLNHMAHYPDLGAVTGVVWTRAVPTEPLVYKHAGVGAYWGFSLNPEDPPEDIHAAGAGCLMARVEAIQKMAAPYWTDEKTVSDDGGSHGVIGHDIRFMRNMREQTGFRVCVDGSIQCHHFDVEGQRLFHMPEDMPSRAASVAMMERHAKITDLRPEITPAEITPAEITPANILDEIGAHVSP